MAFARRLHALLFVTAIALFPASAKASLVIEHLWTLNQLAKAPVLVVARVLSLKRANGPHFTGDPKHSAPPQTMTAEVAVLRSFQQSSEVGAPPPPRLKIRFVGRDGPDFSQAPVDFPDLEPGQVLLLPLRAHPAGSPDPWQLIGADGYGLTTRVAANMGEPALPAHDARLFLIRELVNSLRRGDPIALLTASSILKSQAAYVQPEFPAQLERSIGNNQARWAEVLGSVLVSYLKWPPLTFAEFENGEAEPSRHFQSLPLAQLALRHLAGNPHAETLVWKSLLKDLPGLADEPYHPLFSYNYDPFAGPAVTYLSNYRNNPAFLKAVITALRQDRPGSSDLASRLIHDGQNACLPEALDRAMKVIRRPFADGGDVFSAIQLILHYGTPAQRRQFAVDAAAFKSTNPDYSAFLYLKMNQAFEEHRPPDKIKQR